jgi:hypothetical protein
MAGFGVQLMKDQGVEMEEINNPPAEEGAKPDDTAAAKTIPPVTPKTDVPATATPNDGEQRTDIPVEDASVDDLDEERVIQYLKKKGFKGDKLEFPDAPPAPEPALTPDQIQKNKEDFQANAVKWALNSDKIKKADLQSFYAESAKPAREIVHQLMTAEWIKADPTLTPEEADSRFREYFLEDEDEGHWAKKIRETEMVNRANNYFAQKYGDVLGAEDAYAEHIEVLDKAKKYNEAIEKTFASLPKELVHTLTIDGEDGQKETLTYKVPYSEATLNAVKEQLLKQSSFDYLGRGEINDEALTKAALLAIREKELDKIISTVARSHADRMVLANKAGRRSIPTRTGDGSQEVVEVAAKSVALSHMNGN